MMNGGKPMSAIIVSALIILGFLVSSFFIRSRWNYYKSDPFGLLLDMLRSENVLTRIWPVEDNFMSLHFSMSRHMIFGVLSIAVMYFSPDSPISFIIPILNLLYAISKLPLYNARRRELSNHPADTREILIPVKQACFIMVVYGFYVYVLTFIFYGIRP